MKIITVRSVFQSSYISKLSEDNTYNHENTKPALTHSINIVSTRGFSKFCKKGPVQLSCIISI